MHNAAYQALGLDWNYGLVDCLTESEAQSFIETLDWLALNVTTPYKPLAFKKATWRTSDAQQAGGAQKICEFMCVLLLSFRLRRQRFSFPAEYYNR